jgi:hypothetical protein
MGTRHSTGSGWEGASTVRLLLGVVADSTPNESNYFDSTRKRCKHISTEGEGGSSSASSRGSSGFSGSGSISRFVGGGGLVAMWVVMRRSAFCARSTGTSCNSLCARRTGTRLIRQRTGKDKPKWCSVVSRGAQLQIKAHPQPVLIDAGRRTARSGVGDDSRFFNPLCCPPQ